MYAKDPEAAVLQIIRAADRPVSRGDILAALESAGVDRAAAVVRWKRLRPTIKAHENVVVADHDRYRWVEAEGQLDPQQALAALARGRLSAKARADLVDIVTAAMRAPNGDAASAARQRQAAIDDVRAFAELAIEMEELVANQASARAMVHRLRARAKLAGLEPVDRAGAATTFDPKRHKPIGAPIGYGRPVVVVRPGYLWHAPTEDVLIAKAVVQDMD